MRRLLATAMLFAVATVLALGVGTASVGATASGIEGVWSFNGGQIAVQRSSNGTYAGTVVAETKFAECVHPVGQQIWTNMTKQPDGSYWGFHQWYFGSCQENPQLGPTAWRILEAANGSHYLRVCFSHPGTSQPMIAANGAPKEASEYAAYHVTYGCEKSSLLGSVPGTEKEGGSKSKEGLTLPSAKKCLGGRRFKIRLRNPMHDPFKTVTITLNGTKIATSHKGNYVVATINLSGLPKGGILAIKVRATTVLGHHLSAKRKYHACMRKMKQKKRGKKG
jgi:hypothetical protein